MDAQGKAAKAIQALLKAAEELTAAQKELLAKPPLKPRKPTVLSQEGRDK